MVAIPQVVKLTLEAYSDQEFQKSTGMFWEAMFNPTELSFTRKNTFGEAKSPGTTQPQTSYISGEPDEVTLELFFDGTGVVESFTSVRDRVDGLLDFMAYDSEQHQPNYVHASWGPWHFLGVITNTKVTYKLFDREGEPLRATASVTLKEVIAPKVLARFERRASPDLFQTWQVRAGDSVDRIAHEVYGSSDYWRPLAKANGLDNPRHLVAGSSLILPPKARA
jgi:Contractile injection system tube protein/LysM domain